MAQFGLITFILMTVLSVVGPILSPYSNEQQNLLYGAQAPNLKH